MSISTFLLTKGYFKNQSYQIGHPYLCFFEIDLGTCIHVLCNPHLLTKIWRIKCFSVICPCLAMCRNGPRSNPMYELMHLQELGISFSSRSRKFGYCPAIAMPALLHICDSYSFCVFSIISDQK